MQDALKRLRALQAELESLHRTTAKVLAESEQLIGQLERPTSQVPGLHPPAAKRRRKPARPSSKGATTGNR